MRLHLKQCPKAKLAKKREYNQRNTQSLEYRTERLKPFLENLEGYDLENMTDLQFNALADNLAALNLQKQQKEIELESNRLEAEIAFKAEELKAMEQAKKDLERKKEEDAVRTKQLEIEAGNIKRDLDKREKIQNEISEKIKEANPEDVPVSNKIISEINTIDKTIENLLPKGKETVIDKPKKKGRPKKVK
jgi:Skp family chaperone for outer membrane proteins